MASRGVASVPVFYVSESGVAYQLADESEKVDNYDVEESRLRLLNKLRHRRQQQQEQDEKNSHISAAAAEASTVVNPQEALSNLNLNDDDDDDDDDDWEDVDSDDEKPSAATAASSKTAPNNHTSSSYTGGSELALRRIELQQQRLANSLVDREQQLKMNKLLARGARLSNRTKANTTKSIASQFYYKEKPADNKAARAVVHHTSSHYHMAGGVQFQRGLRVKGVVSRHSSQGAKLQAARMAQRNMYAAREDARGERAEGLGRSQGKTKKSKSKKSKKSAEA